MDKKDSLSNNLAFYLKHLRKKNNFKLDELAALSNLSVSYLSRLENGICSSPSITVLENLSQAYNISLIELFNIAKNYEKEDTIPTLEELIIKNDFTYKGKMVDTYIKKSLLNFIDTMMALEINNEVQMEYLFKICSLTNNFIIESRKEA